MPRPTASGAAAAALVLATRHAPAPVVTARWPRDRSAGPVELCGVHAPRLASGGVVALLGGPCEEVIDDDRRYGGTMPEGDVEITQRPFDARRVRIRLREILGEV